MKELRALVISEARLLFREPVYWLVTILLPTAILVIFGTIFGPSKPDPALGGLRFVDVFVPSLVVITVATLGIQTLPIRLANYREKGVLRRLSTTPSHPYRLLLAQFTVYAVTAVVALGLLIVVANIAFGVPWPKQPIAYIAAFALGMSSLFAIGLVIASVAPSVGVATAVALPLFFAVMLLGGVYVPRAYLPDVMIRIGEFTPPGVQGLQDAWVSTSLQPLPLVALVVITLVGGALAARMFRWE
jgi:ABC-2 type transport system permease protein